MIACLDVAYRDRGAVAACVLFRAWSDDQPVSEVVAEVAEVEPYISGQFFRRELPCLLAVLKALDERPHIVIIDGYVWLEGERNQGLGAHLYDVVGPKTAVIGVAKSKFLGASLAREVTRGRSLSPLYVTAAGMDLSDAAHYIREMHGEFRVPTLLKRVDQLSRGRGRNVCCGLGRVANANGEIRKQTAGLPIRRLTFFTNCRKLRSSLSIQPCQRGHSSGIRPGGQF